MKMTSRMGGLLFGLSMIISSSVWSANGDLAVAKEFSKKHPAKTIEFLLAGKMKVGEMNSITTIAKQSAFCSVFSIHGKNETVECLLPNRSNHTGWVPAGESVMLGIFQPRQAGVHHLLIVSSPILDTGRDSVFFNWSLKLGDKDSFEGEETMIDEKTLLLVSTGRSLFDAAIHNTIANFVGVNEEDKPTAILLKVTVQDLTSKRN